MSKPKLEPPTDYALSGERQGWYLAAGLTAADFAQRLQRERQRRLIALSDIPAAAEPQEQAA